MDGSIRSIALLGVGLMGGSLGLAAQRYAGVTEVRGFDVNRDAVEEALALGAITEGSSTVQEAVAGINLALVCTPVRTIPRVVEESACAEPPPRLISDIGSTKQAVMRALSARAGCRFIGGHPMCGAETSGVRFARADLFMRATYFLCASPEILPQDYELLYSFVAQLGARPIAIDAEAHDRIMALVSHVPHVLANLVMGRVGAFEAGGRRALFSVGPSFKDLTRVAGANSRIWRDIFLENQDAVVKALRAVAADMEEFCADLEAGREEAVTAAIDIAAAYRQELLEHEDIRPETLYRLTVRIPDEPGVLSRVMAALGDAGINIEDLTLHHFNRRLGGDLVLFVSGEEAATTGRSLLNALGYPTVLAFSGGPIA